MAHPVFVEHDGADVGAAALHHRRPVRDAAAAPAPRAAIPGRQRRPAGDVPVLVALRGGGAAAVCRGAAAGQRPAAVPAVAERRAGRAVGGAVRVLPQQRRGGHRPRLDLVEIHLGRDGGLAARLLPHGVRGVRLAALALRAGHPPRALLPRQRGGVDPPARVHLRLFQRSGDAGGLAGVGDPLLVLRPDPRQPVCDAAGNDAAPARAAGEAGEVGEAGEGWPWSAEASRAPALRETRKGRGGTGRRPGPGRNAFAAGCCLRRRSGRVLGGRGHYAIARTGARLRVLQGGRDLPLRARHQLPGHHPAAAGVGAVRLGGRAANPRRPVAQAEGAPSDRRMDAGRPLRVRHLPERQNAALHEDAVPGAGVGTLRLLGRLAGG